MSNSSLPSTISCKICNSNIEILKTNQNEYINSDDEDELIVDSLSSSDVESGESDDNERNSGENDTEIKLMIEASDKKGNSNVKYYNKSFSQNKLREIERNNTLLMNKILSNSVRKNQYPAMNVPQIKMTSNTINKRRRQQEIDRNNLLLLKRIQSIKPFGLSQRKQ